MHSSCIKKVGFCLLMQFSLSFFLKSGSGSHCDCRFSMINKLILTIFKDNCKWIPKAFKFIIFVAVQPTNLVASNLLTTCVQCNMKLFQRNRLLLPAVRLKLLKQPLGPLNLTGDRFRYPWRWLYKSLKEQPISRRSPQREQIPVRSAS